MHAHQASAWGCSGKVVITGAKKREEIHEALDNIYSILLQFQKSY